MDRLKKNPKLIVILAILFVTGVVFAEKFGVAKPTASNKVLADEGENGDKADETEDEKDEADDEDKDENKDEDKNDDEDKDEDEDRDKERSKSGTQKIEDDEDEADDDEDEIDDDADEDDDEDEAGEDLKDINELIGKVERRISAVAANGGSVDGFNVTLGEVKDLVSQAQAKLASGDKAAAEDLMEAADDKLEDLEESVKLVLGEREDDDEDESDSDDEDEPMSKEYKNVVAQFVHDLKAAMKLEGVEGGIGDRVSVIAETQNASQKKVVKLLDEVEEQNKFKRFLVGSDSETLDEIKQEIAKNAASIQILTQMLGQTDNANVKIVLERQIQVLQNENLKLQNFVTSAESVPSMFGWLVRMFS